ncbi:MAG: ribonuclease R [Clostridiales bacterium]|nr:ribonuclease R [Clostridiales bacterium]
MLSENTILEGVKSGRLKNKTAREIFSILKLRQNEKKNLKTLLLKLCDKGELFKTPHGGFLTPEQAGAFKGTLRGNERGFAFITPESGEHDFFVPRRSVNGAYDGDTVLAVHIPDTKDEALVVRVLERGNKQVVGTLSKNRNTAYVYPDNLRLPRIYVPNTLISGAQNGYKVVCEITSYLQDKAPCGKVVEVLGEGGDLDSEELSIIRELGLEEEFLPAVSEEAERASKAPIVLDGRRDLRSKLIFTIDGEDTRDIDDAVSLEREGENYILGVHIADVSYYVKHNSTLDKSAYARGTSVYFPDRVLPMLPKALSNGACSLNEGEDRYTLSCEMKFNKEGERLSYDIFKSVISSSHRTTYTEIAALCEKDPQVCRKYGDLTEIVSDMADLCVALESRRKSAGEVNLEVKEAHIYIDNDGEIVIPTAERNIAHRIIEQFMICANEAVAEFLQSKSAPCLYRIHEPPAPEKCEKFADFLRDLGLTVKLDYDSVTPKDFRNILTESQDLPAYSVINKIMLRTMQKARYCERNLKHFGLASECYCHFTSPIRRYPDLFVHRVIKCVLDGKSFERYDQIANMAGIDCSERERVADEAERKVDDLYKLAYMSEKLGETYDAVISSVTGFGIFCELDNAIEGLIRLEDLPDDAYEFFENKFLLKGRKHSYKIGDSIKVEVADCDLGTMKVLFIPAL